MEVGFLWLAELLMVYALGCFLRAFWLRKRDRAAHMRAGKQGAYVVFGALGAVEFVLRVLGWDFPLRSERMLHWHIAVASVTLALLGVLLWTGVTRRRAIHVRLYPVFLPLYVATVVLSFCAFRLW